MIPALPKYFGKNLQVVANSPMSISPKFRLTAPEPYEREVHERCAKILNEKLLPPALWCCYPAGAAQLSPQQQARYTKLGLKRGFPDLMVFYRSVYGLEIKRQGGTLSKTRVIKQRGILRVLLGQEEVFEHLLKTGAWSAIAIIHSPEEMLEKLREWEIPLRPGAG